MNYQSRRNAFRNQFDWLGGNASKIWVELRKDFQSKDTSLRGYGLSTLSEKRRKQYLIMSRVLNFPFRIITKLFSQPNKYINKTLSWILLGDTAAASKYDFDAYSNEMYDEGPLNEFLDQYSKYDIGFSHNTFKSFYYLKKLKESVPLERNLKVFEIGAGVFNFGHLLSLEVDRFEYVICDLPEMIFQAHHQMTELYIPKCGGDYDVFLPNELKEFDNSDNGRKVLFITPEQLGEGVLGEQKRFDLFVNHESFAEMEITTVNQYLSQLPALMKVGSVINIVNRHTRPQAKSSKDYEKLGLDEITCFRDYQLEFCDCLMQETDKFRAKIPGQQATPNVFFIGKMKT